MRFEFNPAVAVFVAEEEAVVADNLSRELGVVF